MNLKIKKIHFFNSPILKIVKPIWYFSIFANNSKNWIDYKKLDKNIVANIDICHDYSTKYLTKIDAAYQLINNGFIIGKNEKVHTSLNLEDKSYIVTVRDQYIFLRRMYKKIWIYYTLISRIISLKVTMDDIISIFKTNHIEQLQICDKVSYSDYNSFESRLVEKKPLINIIIPTLNRYENLKSLLLDLEKQTYKNFNIFIIDQSKPFKPDFYKTFSLTIKVMYQKEKALWRARNQGIKNSETDFLLFLDDDSKVGESWILEHIRCMDYFNADISAGISISEVGAPVPKNYSYFRIADQLDTGNVMMKRDVLKKCGLFDLHFEKMRMGDGEFGLRAHLNGFKIIHNPLSKRNHLKVKEGGLREMGSWDGLRPKNIFNLRPIPSVLYFYRSYWGDSNTLFSLIQTIPLSLTPYAIKGRLKGYVISIILFILFFPLIIYKVHKSWKFSDNMINKGPMIENY